MTDTVSLQYHGFRQTPNLWLGAAVYGLKAFDYDLPNHLPLADFQHLPQRLGKRVEHFVAHELKQLSHIQWLADGLQIQRNKQTIGELDALLQTSSGPVHLEIVYKFYLYDASVGSTPLEHWIGPNRKDSFVKKLNKLKNKQLPLLYRPETCSYLDDLGLTVSDIEQQVLFKAQLFIPYGEKTIDIHPLNRNCIAGYYLDYKSLPSWSHCLFYMPSKCNWLATPHADVLWQDYASFTRQVTVYLEQKQSPLVWITHPDKSLTRLFVVWW